MNFFGMSFEALFPHEDVFSNDLKKSSYTRNPKVIPDIDLVYILSGRTTAKGADADGLKREFDLSDDIERLKEGIRVATEINALRAGKHPNELAPKDFVIPIFYNGRAIHNKHLREALEEGLFDYPKELFVIHDIHPENTIGQIQSFKRYISENEHRNIAVVSSAYHIARVARTIGKESPQVQEESGEPHPLSEVNIFLFGVHKNEKRLGIAHDLIGEHNAMKNYSSGSKPSISRYQSNNVFLTNEDFLTNLSFKKARFWRSMNKESEDKKASNLTLTICKK